jgi:hypothetical protein
LAKPTATGPVTSGISRATGTQTSNATVRKARVRGRRIRAFGKANSEKPVAAHSCLVKCAEYAAMKLPLYTNNKKDERSRGGRAEGHLAKPIALKASRHGVALVTSDAQAHQFFCVGEF